MVVITKIMNILGLRGDTNGQFRKLVAIKNTILPSASSYYIEMKFYNPHTFATITIKLPLLKKYIVG